ncbi:phosphatase PAP2 family protein [bacterium]|nr:phosphatase PAP2 family protein [bacterium]
MIEYFKTLDHALFEFFNQETSNSVFDFLMPIVTDERFLVGAMLILVLFVGFKYKKRGWIVVGFAILALGISDLLCAQILKPFFGRIRPSHIEGFGNLLVAKGGKLSFPSNHAANAFAASVILQYIFNTRGKILLFSTAAVIAFSRIYVGVHYPVDVLAGAIFGTFLGFCALLILKKKMEKLF